MSIYSGKKYIFKRVYLRLLNNYLWLHDKLFTGLDVIQLRIWLFVSNHKDRQTIETSTEFTSELSLEDHSSFDDVS